MHLVNEQDTWHDLSSSLLSPLCNLLIYLLPHLRLYLSDIPRKKSHKSLSPRIDNIDLVESNGMHHFFPLLQPFCSLLPFLLILLRALCANLLAFYYLFCEIFDDFSDKK